MPNSVRVRYAPSPTGATHVGNVRTAIFTWLFARANDGAFVVRVEDTDQNRNVEGSIDTLLDALAWLGLDWDEGPDKGGPYGPYYQSQRLRLYHEAADALLANGRAYRCYCTPERLAELRRSRNRQDGASGYDGRCRDLDAAERAAHERDGAPAAVRFAMPRDGTTTLYDVIHGEVTFENRLVDDFVMLRSNGFPTYHLANVVDDHHMKISHVMRGDDWISSSPRHVRLYEALGWDAPQFAHLPMILAPDRSKLGKRHGAASVLDYREMGYLPQTMVNFLSLLGWSLDDKTDIISRDDLVRNFTIERVSKAGAVFNVEKLNWMNGAYIRALTAGELADALAGLLESLPAAGDWRTAGQATSDGDGVAGARAAEGTERGRAAPVLLLPGHPHLRRRRNSCSAVWTPNAPATPWKPRSPRWSRWPRSTPPRWNRPCARSPKSLA